MTLRDFLTQLNAKHTTYTVTINADGHTIVINQDEDYVYTFGPDDELLYSYPTTRHYTRYIAHELDFHELSCIVADIEEEHGEFTRLNPEHKYTFDILDLFTGEVLACRDKNGLWELNR